LDLCRLPIAGLRIPPRLGTTFRRALNAVHGAAIPPAGPANAVVEFENDSIVVVRIRMAPGEKTPMHDITSARLVVWLTDVHLRDTHADGSTDDIRRRAGDIDWTPVQRHAGENLAHEPLEFLAIVPKRSGESVVR
jgi:quercetin dioxygenase-like cupin family protein